MKREKEKVSKKQKIVVIQENEFFIWFATFVLCFIKTIKL